MRDGLGDVDDDDTAATVDAGETLDISTGTGGFQKVVRCEKRSLGDGWGMWENCGRDVKFVWSVEQLIYETRSYIYRWKIGKNGGANFLYGVGYGIWDSNARAMTTFQMHRISKHTDM